MIPSQIKGFKELGPGVRIRGRFWKMVKENGLSVGDVVTGQMMQDFHDGLPKYLQKVFHHSYNRLIHEQNVQELPMGGLKILVMG